MKILLTGATGYIGRRLLPILLSKKHEVVCCVRDAARFDAAAYNSPSLTVIEVDLLDEKSVAKIPADIDAAYYLVHSMNSGKKFESLEKKSAQNFADAISKTSAKQVVYLSGIINDDKLSKHLSSRKEVEHILNGCSKPVTTLRAGIIVGSGSASFEIIRDLVEKLPVMVAPKWLYTKCQPIAIRNVIEFLSGVLLKEETFDKNFDIYGPDILTYKQMLFQYAEVRRLKRYIITVPVMTPKLSSYWLYFVTSTSYALAKNLVGSMKVDVVARPNTLAQDLEIELLTYKQAIVIAFEKIEQNIVMSSWKDAFGIARANPVVLSQHIQIPEFGCYKDHKERVTESPDLAINRIFAIGGQSGWYYADWLWDFRGFIDKLFGGVGLQRGRRNNTKITAGESLDFWRVIYSNTVEKRLLLYAEMKLPGEAWLEFKVVENTVIQTATFRPLGLFGRVYWYAMLPFHYFIFDGMIRKITAGKP